jgi:hypothetical protein
LLGEEAFALRRYARQRIEIHGPASVVAGLRWFSVRGLGLSDFIQAIEQ